MSKATIAGGALIAALVLLTAVAGYRSRDRAAGPLATPGPQAPLGHLPGFLYGRVTTVGGATFEGRLRFGRSEEAFWGDTFNGFKRTNDWLPYVPPEARPMERRRIEILGIRLVDGERPLEVRRQLMVRFGDIARIEAHGREVRVTLKSGNVYELDRLEAGDFDDGVRVWDLSRGLVELDSLRVRTIEFLPTPALEGLPTRLHGTVRTRSGEFTGFVQWDREAYVGTDTLDGRGADGEVHLPFDTLRSIERRSPGGTVAVLLDGREVGLPDSHDARGTYVDDPRYGRVLVGWDAFERVDLRPGGSGPAYDDFPPGQPLKGGVTTRVGRRHVGRLVFDLDESETIETLDAPSDGVEYNLPFGRVASIVLPGSRDARARVTLHGGEELQLEREGDLGPGNAGILVFVDGRERPEYLPWADVERVDLDPPTTPVR
jgi:hypothetical protein